MPIRNALTFAGGQILTAAQMNTGISDFVRDFTGDNGAIEFEGPLAVTDDASDFIDVPTGTTAQRPAHAAGRMRYNTTLDEMEYSQGSAWRDLAGDTGVVTYGNLDSNGDVGSGANQVARGNHTH